MNDGIKFDGLEMTRGKLVKDCGLEIDDGDYRTYALHSDEYHRADVICVQFVSCTDTDDNVWDSPELQVEVVFRAVCLFDGVRHLNFNSEGEGYLYYPEMDRIIRALEHLHTMADDIEKQLFPGRTG